MTQEANHQSSLQPTQDFPKKSMASPPAPSRRNRKGRTLDVARARARPPRGSDGGGAAAPVAGGEASCAGRMMEVFSWFFPWCLTGFEWVFTGFEWVFFMDFKGIFGSSGFSWM